MAAIMAAVQQGRTTGDLFCVRRAPLSPPVSVPCDDSNFGVQAARLVTETPTLPVVTVVRSDDTVTRYAHVYCDEFATLLKHCGHARLGRNVDLSLRVSDDNGFVVSFTWREPSDDDVSSSASSSSEGEDDTSSE